MMPFDFSGVLAEEGFRKNLTARSHEGAGLRMDNLNNLSGRVELCVLGQVESMRPEAFTAHNLFLQSGNLRNILRYTGERVQSTTCEDRSMAKKPGKMGAEGTKKADRASAPAVQTVSVVEGDTRSYDELMKPPKAQLVRQMAIPANKRRFIIDVDNRTRKGKRIIALMESLRDGDKAAIKKVTEILETLAGTGAKKSTPEK
jgi:hypothetical protein